MSRCAGRWRTRGGKHYGARPRRVPGSNRDRRSRVMRYANRCSSPMWRLQI